MGDFRRRPPRPETQRSSPDVLRGRRLRTRPLPGRGRPLGGKRAPVGQINLLVAASPAQRDKVARMGCLVCGRTPVDAAHIVPQRLGGCADPACCAPLCRACHKRWDAGGFDLRPYLGEDFGAELEHALTHVDAAALERGLSGGGWCLPRWRRKR